MIRLRQGLLVGMLFVAALVLASCAGGGDSDDPEPNNPPAADGDGVGTIVDDDNQPPGLDARPANPTCVAPDRPTQGATIATVDAFPNLPSVNQPTKILLEPVADPRWFVLEKTGEVLVFDPDNATTLRTFLDFSSVVRTNSEGGLLGLAFHPSYPTVPEVFVSYTRHHSRPSMRSVISRMILDDVNRPGAGTVEQVLIEIDQDFDNHNGGDIAFGADGYLYIGLGDGGSGNDPNNRAQDTRHLLGSFLRLDVTGPGVNYPSVPYAIPADNPFALNPKCGPGLNASACPEIYAWGMRNPWRWAFDRPTGQLWAADVGQGTWEEIDLIERGGNYGWRCSEGAHDHIVSGCGSGFVEPVSEYGHSNGNESITGGYVYRGASIADLVGRYVFADFESGRIWALQVDGQGGYTNEELINTPYGITAFGVDDAGELYFTDFFNGRIRRIEPGAGSTPDTVPDLLSQSGCVDTTDVTQVGGGLVPYGLHAPFWSDGAVKERYFALPDGAAISIDKNDDWVLPPGAVVVKNFRLNGRLIETRHLMRHPDGVWAGYTYAWNAVETEATRVRGGKTVDIDGQPWIYPSEGECMQCHTAIAGFSLGLETAQLNAEFTYPSTQRTADQLLTLEHIDVFDAPLPDTPDNLPRLPEPSDATQSLTERTRSYLHTNCAQCHQSGGPTPSSVDLRYTVPLSGTNTCDALPQAGDLGIADARIIALGDASRSVLVARVGRRDAHGMPPLGSHTVDVDGMNLLTDWIESLSSCN